MISELPDCIEMNPSGDPAAVVIWLHGLGADGHDFEAIVPELRLPDTLPLRYVFPHAPLRAVTINGSVVMRAWFDIFDVELTVDSIDLDQFRESAGMLTALIENEMQSGMASDRIVLAGFSQGGAIVLHTGLHCDKQLAGILAMSMHLPTIAQTASTFSAAGQQVPIMMAHGQTDPVIPLPKAIKTRQALTGLGYAVDWYEYPMPHAVCAEEIEDIRAWLLKILARD
ncbi:MAG: alpha/beta hydrolase [Desulfobacterales bacterium]